MAIHPQVGGQWLADICPFGQVVWATAWQGGLDTFSWQIPIVGTFPELRRGATVTLMDCGLSLGSGTITSVGDGQVSGEGLWKRAYEVPALDAVGDPTTVPNTAIGEAIARGDLPGWGGAWSISGADMSTDVPDAATSVGALLDAYATSIEQAWFVDSTGMVDLRGLAATPTWQTTPADGQLTVASDEYVSHLVGTYYVSVRPGVPAARIYPAATVTPESAKWGRVTRTVDLRAYGAITTATVDAILAGMLAKGRARPTWADTLEVVHGEITTLGGTPVNLGTLVAGEGVRLHGTFDDPDLLGGFSFTDITAGRVEYADGAATAQVTPVGYTPRDFKTILTLALGGTQTEGFQGAA